MENCIERDNYITIIGFMVTDLHLKGSELLIYAIIYGFSQNGQAFRGSLRYLEEWTNCSKQGVLNSLQSLEEKGLIEKKTKLVNGVKLVDYRSTKLTGVVNKVDRGGEKSLPHKLKDILIDKLEEEKEYKEKEVSVRFVKPTVADVAAYCAERHNGIDPQMFCDFYEAKGWRIGNNPMKDWRAAVRTWERKRKEGNATAVPSETTETLKSKYAGLNIGDIL